MHIRNYPQVFVKDGKQRNVYYTAEARELISLGWKQQSMEPPATPVKAKAPEQPAEPPVAQEQAPVIVAQPVPLPVAVEAVEPETIVAEQAKPDAIVVQVAQVAQVEQGVQAPALESLTRVELLQYALDRGVDLPNNALKAELLKSCKEIKNG
jgi:hypothetical protein